MKYFESSLYWPGGRNCGNFDVSTVIFLMYNLPFGNWKKKLKLNLIMSWKWVNKITDLGHGVKRFEYFAYDDRMALSECEYIWLLNPLQMNSESLIMLCLYTVPNWKYVKDSTCTHNRMWKLCFNFKGTSTHPNISQRNIWLNIDFQVNQLRCTIHMSNTARSVQYEFCIEFIASNSLEFVRHLKEIERVKIHGKKYPPVYPFFTPVVLNRT